MNPETPLIENLSWVELTLTGGLKPENTDPSGERLKIRFIFGIGSEGLTPFEYEIARLPEGASVTIPLTQVDYPSFFEHIPVFYPKLPQTGSPVYLHVTIDGIRKATNREVIQEMAALAAGCSCGCGCDGGHHAGDGCGGKCGH